MTRNDTKIAVDLGAGIDGSGVAGNDHRSLTRSLDLGEEGLMAHSMPPSDEDGRHPVDAHWFVGDHTGSYCLACNLPRANRRHVARAA